MSQIFTNNAISLLDISISNSDLNIYVIPGDGVLFPQPLNSTDFFLVTLEDSTASTREIIKIIGRTGDVLHVDPTGRGFENTNPHSWPIDTLVDHRLTAFTLNKIDHPISTSNLINVTTDPLNPQQVLSHSIKDVDIFTTTTYNRSCKWMVTVFDNLNRISISEILAVYKDPITDPDFTVFAKTGDPLKYHFSVLANGNNMLLRVINDDNVNLTYVILRINYQ
jgi:hypothetical protein